MYGLKEGYQTDDIWVVNIALIDYTDYKDTLRQIRWGEIEEIEQTLYGEVMNIDDHYGERQSIEYSSSLLLSQIELANTRIDVLLLHFIA